MYKNFEKVTIRASTFYEQSYFHGRRSARDKRFEHRVRKARRELVGAMQFVEARAALDVGCSLGYVIEAGQRLGLASAGLDVSNYAVKVCRERGYRAEVGTLERLPFNGAEFDVVTMKHVLEHTPYPREAMAEVRRVLSDRGAVVIAVPNLHYWKGQYRRRTYRYFRPDDLGQQHYVYYTMATLRRLLETSGFDVVTTTKAFFRSKLARRSTWRAIYERGRFGLLFIWQQVAEKLLLRRELYFIATKKAQPGIGTPETLIEQKETK